MSAKNNMDDVTETTVIEIYISAKDFARMEDVLVGLDRKLRRSLVGTGYDITAGVRDHHFIVRGITRARKVISAYRRSFRKTGLKVEACSRKGGVYTDIKVEGPHRKAPIGKSKRQKR